MIKSPDFWVYILCCENGHFYVGYTTDLIKRYRLHKAGKAAKYTRGFPPSYLAQVWPIYGPRNQAMHIERILKTMDRYEKQIVVDDHETLEKIILKTFSE